MERLMRELGPDDIGPPQPISHLVGAAGPTSMYRLMVLGVVTPKLLRNVCKMLEVQASILDEVEDEKRDT